MKYQELLSSPRNKKVMFAGGAVAGCLIVAAAVYFGLQMIAPRSSDSKSQTSSTGQKSLNAKEQLAKQADASFLAGDKALEIGDAEKGIAELEKALKIYEQIGDVIKMEQARDQIALAKYALEQEKKYESAEKQADQGKALKTP